MSDRTTTPNSDGATVVLEGQSMASGHLTLAHWALSLDSFWSIDAVFNTIFVFLDGVRADLLRLVPAIIASCVVVLGIRIACDGYKKAPQIAAAATVIALLGLPTFYLCYFFLSSVSHVGTTLWCLIAFFALSRERRRTIGPSWAIGVIFLAAGLLGDLQMFALGVVPVLLAGIVRMMRARSLRAGLPLVAASVTSLLVAGFVRGIAELIGTYSIGKVQGRAKGAQIRENFSNLVSGIKQLLGQRSGLQGALKISEQLHVVLLVLVVALVGVGLLRLIVGGVTGNAKSEHRQRDPANLKAMGWLVDDLLLFGCVGGMVTFVVLASANDFNYDRYLTSAVVFGVILGARQLAWLLSSAKSTWSLLPVTAVGLAVIGVFCINIESMLASPDVAWPETPLVNFLEAHHLDQGIGDYWSASIVTVVSNGNVTVRPVISNPAGKLVRYDRQSSSDWYEAKSFQFLVYNLAIPVGVELGTATSTFGEPDHTYQIGTFTVLTWSHPVSVSLQGYDPNAG
ncbi:MAG: hypothetical protein WAM97_16785 [Acidimicrobiales bacterium]